MKLGFKIFLRRWRKQKLYSFISLLSLIIGLTCSIILVSFVVEEYRIGNSYSGKKQIYQVFEEDRFFENQKIKKNSVLPTIAKNLQENIPEIINSCVVHQKNYSLIKNNKEIYLDKAFQVLPEFFDFFEPEMISGDLKTTLSTPYEIAVTRSFAIKYLNKEDPIGERLFITSYIQIEEDNRTYPQKVNDYYTITSVIDDSEKSIFDYELLFPLEEKDYLYRNLFTGTYNVFVKLNHNSSVKDIEHKINELEIAKKFSDKVYLVPINELYFTDSGFSHNMIHYRNKTLLHMGLVVAIILFFIACFNYININMTIYIFRLRAIGQQILFGSSKWHLFLQLVQENILMVLAGFIVSLGLVHVLLPIFNEFMFANLKLSTLFTFNNFIFLIFILLLFSVIPAVYVYLQLSKNSLNDTLKKNGQHRSKIIVIIIIIQFAISFGLLSYMNIFNKQMDYILYRNENSEKIIEIHITDENDIIYWKDFERVLRQSPFVKNYTYYSLISASRNSSPTESAYIQDIDNHFIDLYDLKIIEGESLDKKSHEKNEILINHTLKRKNNLNDPIGSTFRFMGVEYHIKGVIEDFQLAHFSIANEPMILRFQDENEDREGIIVISASETEIINKNFIQNLWNQYAPDGSLLSISSLKEKFIEMHKDEYRMMQIVRVFSIISIILSLLGLFGIAWFSVESRTKEIALRKINGSTTGQVLILLILRFLKWITLGCIIILPISWYLCQKWLSKFVYRVDLTINSFIITYCLIVIIGVITVLGQSWVAARKNPVDTIKMD